MKIKKISAALWALMMVLSLAACGNRGTNLEEIPSVEQSEMDSPVKTLHLLSGEALQWGEEEIDGEYVCLGSFRVPLISLADDEKELYPGLQSAFEDLTAEQYMERLSVFEEALEGVREGLNDGVSVDEMGSCFVWEDVRVRRGDERAVSLLFEGSGYLSYIRNTEFRYCRSASFDTETGERLSLKDVVNDVSAIPALIEKRLDDCYPDWRDQSYDYVDLKDCFEEGNDAWESFEWTLEYDSITFYFQAQQISWYPMTATISFDSAPGLVKEEYTQTPEYYGIEIPADTAWVNLDWISDYRDFYGKIYDHTAIRPTFLHTSTGDYLNMEYGADELYVFDTHSKLYTTDGKEVQNLEYQGFLGDGENYRESITQWWRVLTNPEEETDVGDNEITSENQGGEEQESYSYYTQMKTQPFNEQTVAGTSWTGVYAGIPENGNSFYLPRTDADGEESNVSITIHADKTGDMDYYGEKIGFTWSCDSQYSIDIEMDDGYGASAFLVAEEAEDRLVYLQLCIGEEVIWMYED
ncbi:MAG: hypothetical protein ACI4AB_06325 [Acetatifactor sp.]